MSKKVIFLDIDGPMIPGRAYMLPNQTKPIVMTFDPVAVSLINHLCDERDWKVVIHSSWIRVWGGGKTLAHCIKQGIDTKHFHPTHPVCDEEENWRYTRVAKWLEEHPECEQYAILDDEPYQDDLKSHYKHPEDLARHLILIDFEDGILSKHYRKLHDGAWHRVLDQ